MKSNQFDMIFENHGVGGHEGEGSRHQTSRHDARRSRRAQFQISRHDARRTTRRATLRTPRFNKKQKPSTISVFPIATSWYAVISVRN